MFCDELFDISENGEQTDELHTFANHMMCHQFVLDYTSAILSIVLSHQFQKDDIKKMVSGTSVDFLLVRDTMYKYSKKAEERFFSNPCTAYFFIQFACSEKGREYITNKIAQNGQDFAEDLPKGKKGA